MGKSEKKSEINISISQTKKNSLVNRVEEVETRVSRMEDKVEELDQTVNDHERMLRKYKWKSKISRTP
jgi:uncharacterized coiled-coil protein SlyX